MLYPIPVENEAMQLPSPRLLHASTFVLLVVFALTGVGTALLGSALPAMLSHWSLDDREGGYVFLLAWLGSSLGAVLSRGNPASSVARGLLLVTGACFMLLHAGRLTLFPLIFAYGTGLGITMTSISLLRSQRAGARRSQEMNRMNMLWALGALACPTLARHALQTSRINYLFATAGVVFAMACLWTLTVEPKLSSQHARQTPEASRINLPLPVLLCAFSALIVGVESSLGGWLTTYAQRVDHSVAGAVSATSAFWGGLLLSRALHSMRMMARVAAATTLQVHLWITAVSVVLLCAMTSPMWLLAAALFAGVGLGPLFPTLLTLVLPRYQGTRVFLLAGLGSAAFPWMTGWVSTQTGSLRIGLLVPAATACVLVLMTWQVLRTLRLPVRTSAG